MELQLKVKESLEKLDCPTCLTEKKIILREHLAKATHYARIYAGHMIHLKCIPEEIQNTEIRNYILLLRSFKNRAASVSKFIDLCIEPLPSKVFEPCRHRTRW
jgi:hypothetical protein